MVGDSFGNPMIFAMMVTRFSFVLRGAQEPVAAACARD
jgi:hypothetical protein